MNTTFVLGFIVAIVLILLVVVVVILLKMKSINRVEQEMNRLLTENVAEIYRNFEVFNRKIVDTSKETLDSSKSYTDSRFDKIISFKK